jgi:hypothetical protein
MSQFLKQFISALMFRLLPIMNNGHDVSKRPPEIIFRLTKGENGVLHLKIIWFTCAVASVLVELTE